MHSIVSSHCLHGHLAVHRTSKFKVAATTIMLMPLAMRQELKGNIRVFCRVRPELAGDGPSDATPEPLMQFPSSGTAGNSDMSCL